ncbi:hypothetical protein ACA910_002783 [Epithemia clementina (nom. ined.)]
MSQRCIFSQAGGVAHAVQNSRENSIVQTDHRSPYEAAAAATTNYQKNNNHHRSSDEEKWDRLLQEKNRLLSLEVGSLHRSDFIKVEHLLQDCFARAPGIGETTSRIDLDLSSSSSSSLTQTVGNVAEILEIGFALLDRLALEKEHYRQQRSNNTLQILKPRTVPNLLFAWKQYAISIMKGHDRFSHEDEVDNDMSDLSSHNHGAKQGQCHDTDDLLPRQSTIQGVINSMWDYMFAGATTPSSSEDSHSDATYINNNPASHFRRRSFSSAKLGTDKIWEKVKRYHIARLLEPSAVTFSIVLYTMARVDQNPEKVQDLVRWMEQGGAANVVARNMNNNNNDKNVSMLPLPDKHCYLAVLNAWRNNFNAEKCEEILRDLVQKVQTNQLDPSTINTHHFQLAISAWKQTNEKQEYISQRVMSSWMQSNNKHGREFIAQRVLSIYQLMDQVRCLPDRPICNALMSACGGTKAFDQAAMLNLFQRMKYMGRLPFDQSYKPDQRTYDAMIYGLAHLSHPDSMAKAEEILWEMGQQFGYPMRLRAGTYAAMIRAYSERGEPHKMQRIFEEFRIDNRMLLLTGNADNSGSKSSSIAYGGLFDHRAWLISQIRCVYTDYLQGWSIAGEPEMAAKVLDEIMHLTEQGLFSGPHLAPNTKDFNDVLSAWSRSGRFDAAERADKELDRMISLDSTKKWHCAPDALSFTVLLAAFARELEQDKRSISSRLSYPNPKATSLVVLANRVVERFQQMKEIGIPPNDAAYLTVMTAFAKLGELNAMERTFEEMKAYCNWENGTMNRYKFLTVRLNAWSKAGNPEIAAAVFQEMMDVHGKGLLGITPPLVNFNQILHAWGRSYRPDAAEQADQLLQKFISHRMGNEKKEGSINFQPNEYTFAYVIGLYAKQVAKDKRNQAAINRSVELFWQMKQMGLRPNDIMYHTVIGQLTTANPSQPEQVDKILQDWMTQVSDPQYPKDNVKLLIESLRDRLVLWSKAGNPEQSAQSLADMIAFVEKNKLDTQMIQARDFTVVLQAWLRSDDPDAARKAETLLRQMWDFATTGRFDCFPTIFSYNAVIACWCKSDLPGSVQEARRLLNELKSLEHKPGSGDQYEGSSFIAYCQIASALVRCYPSNSGEGDIVDILQELRASITYSTKEKLPRDARRRLLLLALSIQRHGVLRENTRLNDEIEKLHALL